MIEYKTVKWTQPIERLARDDIRNQFKATCDQTITSNNLMYQSALKDKEKLVQGAIALWGNRSNVVKYLESAKIPKPPLIGDVYDKTMRDLKKWQRKQEVIQREQERRELQAEKRAGYRERQEQAIEGLEANGYALNVDFVRSSAITFRRKVLIEITSGHWIRREDAPLPDEGLQPAEDW